MSEVFVLIPAYNASGEIASVIDRIPPGFRKNVVVVDDGSSDGTADIVGAIEGVTLIRHDQNKGYGGAQTTLYRVALERGADIAVMLHADGGHRPEELPEVLAPILEGSAQMVIGSRILGILDGVDAGLSPRAIRKGRDSEMPTLIFLANILLSKIQNLCYRSRFASFHDGFRAVTADVLSTVPYASLGDWYLYDTEFLVAAHERGIGVVQVPVSTFYERGTSAMGRNIRYGMAVLKHAVSYRLGRNRSWERT